MRVAFSDWGGGQIPQREVKEEGKIKSDHCRCLLVTLSSNGKYFVTMGRGLDIHLPSVGLFSQVAWVVCVF